MSIATQLARVPTQLEVFCPLFGGPIWTGVEPSSTGLGTVTYAGLAAARMVFIPVALEKNRQSFPEIDVWGCDWLVFALLGVNVQANHIRTDGTYAYRVTNVPTVKYGFILGPAAVLPLIEVPGYENMAGLPLLDNDGNILLGG